MRLRVFKQIWAKIAGFMVVITIGTVFTQDATAGFSEEEPIHHFFNARLLDRWEHQISIFGNYKLGILDTLEIGTQGGLFMALQAPNFSLKHRMFRGDGYETAFTSHTVFLQEVNAGGGLESEDESSTETVKTTSIFSAYGVTTTFELAPGSYINGGLLDYFLYQSYSQYNSTNTFHIVTPVIGYDWYLTDSWALSTVLAYPVYLFLHLESDLFDVEANVDLITGLPPRYNPNIFFLTFLHSWDTFNIEFGVVNFMGIMPYLNLFWRLHG